MQSLFYLIEEGDAHYRSGKWNLALKKYAAVQNVGLSPSLVFLFLTDGTR